MQFSKLSMGLFLSLGTSGACAQLSAGAGAEFTTGKYGGTESTEQLYIPFAAKLQAGAWTLKLTVPYLLVSGPANVIGGGEDRIPVGGTGSGGSGSGSGGSGSGSGGSGSGGSGSGGSGSGSSGSGSGASGSGGSFGSDAATKRTTSGLGDIVASASYSLLREDPSAVGLDLGGRVKFGTADETERLGTGENDFSVQADFYKPLGQATAFATLGYRWYGDPPGIELRDVPYFVLGASYRLDGDTAIGFAYDYRPHIVEGGSPISEATLFWSKRFAREWKLQLYALVGFSDGSPDAGVGSFFEYRF